MQGQASDIAIQTNEILTLRARINELYVKHTGQSMQQIGKSAIADMLACSICEPFPGSFDVILRCVTLWCHCS